MLRHFILWFNKPYPLIDNLYVKWLMVFSVGIFTLLFLLIFQPFGIAEIIHVEKSFIGGYAFFVTFGLYISYFIYPKLFKKTFNPDKWLVKKEITFLGISFLQITIFNFLYHNYWVAPLIQRFSIIRFTGITFSIGIIPILFMIFFVENYLNQKNNKVLQLLEKKLDTVPSINKEFEIISENIKAPKLIINSKNFMVACANNNYTTFFYLENNQLQKTMLRISLKKVENQFNNQPNFIRCHKSYIINKDFIDHISGNARSLNIHLQNIDFKIPVSRQFSKDQLQQL